MTVDYPFPHVFVQLPDCFDIFAFIHRSDSEQSVFRQFIPLANNIGNIILNMFEVIIMSLNSYSKIFTFILIFIFCVYVYGRVSEHATVHMWRSEHDFWSQFLASTCVCV